MAEETILVKFFEVQRVPHVGGGDADVNSKDGRVTHVSVDTDNLTIDAGGKSARLTVIYNVMEGRRDFTQLQWAGEVVVEAPGGFKITKVGQGKANADFQKSYQNEDHEWHDESAQVQGTYLSSLEVKFDGKGDDDNGNARMRAIVAIPVTVEKE